MAVVDRLRRIPTLTSNADLGNAAVPPGARWAVSAWRARPTINAHRASAPMVFVAIRPVQVRVNHAKLPQRAVVRTVRAAISSMVQILTTSVRMALAMAAAPVWRVLWADRVPGQTIAILLIASKGYAVMGNAREHANRA